MCVCVCVCVYEGRRVFTGQQASQLASKQSGSQSGSQPERQAGRQTVEQTDMQHGDHEKYSTAHPSSTYVRKYLDKLSALGFSCTRDKADTDVVGVVHHAYVTTNISISISICS